MSDGEQVDRVWMVEMPAIQPERCEDPRGGVGVPCTSWIKSHSLSSEFQSWEMMGHDWVNPPACPLVAWPGPIHLWAERRA